MHCCVRGICCFFGPYPCCFFCQLRESTTTRLVYAFFVIIVGILSLSLYTDSKLNPFPLHDGGLSSICSLFKSFEDCLRLFTFIGIYRLCFPVFCFHIVFALFAIGVSSSQTIRGRIHNGFWLFKILILCGLWIAAYTSRLVERFTLACTIIGIVGSFIFLYIQFISLIDGIYELNVLWGKKMHNSTAYKFLCTIISLSVYLGALSVYAVLFLLYGLPNKCSLNMAMTALNFFFTIIVALCSLVSSKLRSHCLWLTGAFVSSYVAYLTWSALTSQPRYYMRQSSEPVGNLPLTPLQQDESASLLMVAAGELHELIALNKLLGTDDPGVTSPTPTNNSALNICLPVSSSLWSSQVVDDVVNLILLILVIAYSVYCGISVSRQDSRFGLITKRKKLKNMFKQYDEAATQIWSRHNADPLASQEEQCRQMHMLHLLVGAIGDLPSPKSFRRPTIRQYEVKRSRGPIPHALVEAAALRTTDTISRAADVENPIKLASSEPNICISGGNPQDDQLQCCDNNNRLYPKAKETPPKKAKKRIFRRFSTVRAEKKLLKELGKLRLDTLPDGAVLPTSSADAVSGNDLKRSSRKPIPPKPSRRARVGARLAVPDQSQLSVDDMLLDDRSPRHIHYRRAHSLSNLAVKPDTTRLLKRRPHLAREFAFIKPLLNKDAPRDSFIVYNDAVAPVYSYAWFHFVLAVCILYIMTSITNWYKPQEAFFATLAGSWPNVYIKLVSGWMALGLYLWTTVNLRFCFGRTVGGTLTPDKPVQ